MEKEILDIKLSEIDQTATDLQIRCENDPDQIDNIKEAIEAGAEIPPILLIKAVTSGPYSYFIADGWHRYYAHHELRKETIRAEVIKGDKEAALRYALGANANHGLRRTNKDKRKAVMIALEKFPKESARSIANLCKVSHEFVCKMKREVSTVDTLSSKNTDEKFAQCDFFAELDATCKQFSETFKQALNHTYFLSDDISNDEKIKTIDAMEYDLKKHHRSLLDLKAKLQDQPKIKLSRSTPMKRDFKG